VSAVSIASYVCSAACGLPQVFNFTATQTPDSQFHVPVITAAKVNILIRRRRWLAGALLR